MERVEKVVNEISKLRNTALSSCNLNTMITIVTSSSVKLYRNRVSARVCYMPIEGGVQM